MAKTTKTKIAAPAETSPQKKPISGKALMQIGNLLGKYAEQFTRLGQHMEENSTAPIVVRGADGVQEFLTRLDNYYGNCSSELGFLKIGEPRLSSKALQAEEEPRQ